MYVLAIVSFLLDGIFLNALNDSVWSPLCSLLSLVILYPYCKKNLRNYYLCCGLLGLFFDIVYTNTLFLNTLFFLICGILIEKLFCYFKKSVMNSYLVALIVILIYRIGVFLFFYLFHLTVFHQDILLHSVTDSFLLNTIYFFSFYGISKKCYQFLKKRKYHQLKIAKVKN